MYKNGFKTIYHNDYHLLVYMDAREISLYNKDREEYIKFYKMEGLNGLAFENEAYYKHVDIEVLKDYFFIKHLFIGQKNIKNLNGISYINNLEGLYLENNLSPLDFDVFKDSLKHLSLSYHKRIKNLDRLNDLFFLHIEKDKDDVTLPKNIKSLELYKSKRTNLNFLRTFNQLNRLELYSNVNLYDINELISCAECLEELEIERCNSIKDFTPILQLKKLHKLSIKLYDKEKSSELIELGKKMKGVDIFIHPESR